MQLKEAIDIISTKFIYKTDKFKYIDSWSILKETDGMLKGDCEDYTLTVFWYMCNKNILKFIWNVLILHKYRLYFVKTKSNEGHAVGYADGYYFDNWTNEALLKDDFIKLTGHSFVWMYISPMIIIKMILGMFIK